MNATNHDHPETAELEAFGLGRLTPARMAAVEEHLAHCDACCQAVQTAPDDTLVAQLRAAAATLPRPRTVAFEGPGEDAVLPDSGRETLPLHAAATDPGRPSPVVADVPAELLDHPRYRVLALLGQGGMGAVYKAEHRRMERLVALKVINPALLDSDTAVRRFHQEVKAAARLQHPHIVTAFDADQAGSLHFLVMEYVEGQSLADLLRRQGPLPIAEACRYVRQAALGLQYAHEQGMVHRDIKPHNLMRTPQGQVKVLDFGLARILADAEAADQTQLTAAGVVMGTADYIAPEQASNAHKADIRADVYSLGCTLYQLLAGQVPFPGGSALDKIVQHSVGQPAPLETLRPNLPAGLASVAATMMAKDPAARYQTPGAVAAALAPFAEGDRGPAAADTVPEREGSQVRRGSKRPRRRLVAGALAVACIAALATAVVVYLTHEQGATTSPGLVGPDRAVADAKKPEVIPHDQAAATAPALAAPDKPAADPKAASDQLPYADAITWDATAFEASPNRYFNFIKRTAAPNEVSWAVELKNDEAASMVRNYNNSFYNDGPFIAQPVVRYSALFLDEDGVAVQIVVLQPNTLDAAPGERVRYTLTMPSDEVRLKTKQVLIKLR